MLKNIKLRKHKGIREIKLLDLGSLNIVCGKNNSGKISILEAIADDRCTSIGKSIDDVSFFVDAFKPQAEGYSNPDPRNGIRWFDALMKEIMKVGRIWFDDEDSNFIEKANKSLKQYHYLSR